MVQELHSTALKPLSTSALADARGIMAPEFKIFHGVGAVVKEVINDTKLSVFAIVDGAKIDFSETGRTFEVNLKATPCTV